MGRELGCELKRHMESQHYLTPSLFKFGYQLFSLMSHPVTRAKNANQHPGKIVLDMKQKHHNSEQKCQDDARMEQEKNKQDAAQACAIKRVADTLISETEAEKNLLTRCWHPRPHSALSQVQPSTTNGMQSDANRLADRTYQSHFLDASELDAQISLGDGMDNMGRNDGEEDEEVPDKEAVSVKTKKRSAQKVTTRDLVEAARTSLHQFPGNHTALVIFHLYSSPQMLLLTETVLFYWDLFDASSSAKEGGAGFGRVRDWAQSNVKGGTGSTRTSASHVTSTSNLFAPYSKSLGVKVKGSTRSSRSIATQPPATPASVVGPGQPVSYLDEDDNTTEFTNFAQERPTVKEWGVSYSMITDTGVSCIT